MELGVLNMLVEHLIEYPIRECNLTVLVQDEKT